MHPFRHETPKLQTINILYQKLYHLFQSILPEWFLVFPVN